MDFRVAVHVENAISEPEQESVSERNSHPLTPTPNVGERSNHKPRNLSPCQEERRVIIMIHVAHHVNLIVITIIIEVAVISGKS